MTKTEAAKDAIVNALKNTDHVKLTARDIETNPTVAQACREAKLKARALLAELTKSGAVKSCGSLQLTRFWI